MNDLDYTGCPCTTCRKHYARGKRSYAYAIVVVVVLAIFLLWAGYASGATFTPPAGAVQATDYGSDSWGYGLVNKKTGAKSPQLSGLVGSSTGLFYHTADSPPIVDQSAFSPGLWIYGGQLWMPISSMGGFYETSCLSEWHVCNVPLRAMAGICTAAQQWLVLTLDLKTVIGQSQTLGGTITPVYVRSFVCPSLPPTTNTPGVIPSPTAVSISPSASPLPVLSPTLIPTATHSTLPCEGAMFGLPCPPGTVSVSTPTTVASSTRTPTAVATAYPSATAVPTTIPATPVSIPSPSPIRATPTIARATPVVLPLTPRPRITVSRTWFPTKSAPSATPTATTSTQGGQTSGGSPGTGSYLALGAILTGIIVKARGWIARQWTKLKSLWKT